jgi:hypothetical protein
MLRRLWIAEALVEHGFCWLVKARTLQRQVDGLVQQVSLQAGSYNRAGGLIAISTYVAARDPAMQPRPASGPAAEDRHRGHDDDPRPGADTQRGGDRHR